MYLLEYRRDNQKMQVGIIEPSTTLPAKFQVAGAKCAVVPASNAKCSYRLLNPMSKTVQIPRNTVIGVYSEILGNSVRLVHASELSAEWCTQHTSEEASSCARVCLHLDMSL